MWYKIIETIFKYNSYNSYNMNQFRTKYILSLAVHFVLYKFLQTRRGGLCRESEEGSFEVRSGVQHAQTITRDGGLEDGCEWNGWKY